IHPITKAKGYNVIFKYCWMVKTTDQGHTGKKIIPVDSGNVQQGVDNAGKELIPAGVEKTQQIVTTKGTNSQQIQVTDKFAILENEESEADGVNQLALVPTDNVQHTNTTPKETGKTLNAAAPTFTPRSPGDRKTKATNDTNEVEGGSSNAEAQKLVTGPTLNKSKTIEVDPIIAEQLDLGESGGGKEQLDPGDTLGDEEQNADKRVETLENNEVITNNNNVDQPKANEDKLMMHKSTKNQIATTEQQKDMEDDTSRVEHVGGDMFESVPEGDTILMKLLKNCYKALPDNGKVIVVEAILPVKPDTDTAVVGVSQCDLIMMAQNPGGKERSEQGFRALATEAGFKGVNLICCVYNFWVMEFCK
ncbi:caffeic acid 3-o-methyltransferase, partial [Nicotiana attenuata]